MTRWLMLHLKWAAIGLYNGGQIERNNAIIQISIIISSEEILLI